MASDKEKTHPLKKAKVEAESTEMDRVEEWRRSEFKRLLGGQVPDDDITTLVNSEADLGVARKLSAEGCPPDLIVRILAPLMV